MAAPRTYNPRDPRGTKEFRKLPKFTTLLLPLSAVFVGAGVWYAIQWSNERRENPCIDCKRQKEIADEIYFGKKRKDSGSRI